MSKRIAGHARLQAAAEFEQRWRHSHNNEQAASKLFQRQEWPGKLRGQLRVRCAQNRSRTGNRWARKDENFKLIENSRNSAACLQAFGRWKVLAVDDASIEASKTMPQRVARHPGLEFAEQPVILRWRVLLEVWPKARRAASRAASLACFCAARAIEDKW